MTVRDEMHLVAVYDDELDARRAVTALQRVGIIRPDVAVEHPDDHVASVQAEKRAPSPERTDDLAFGAIVGAALGVLVAVPFAAFELGPFEFWSRAFLLTLVGAVLGSTIGAAISRGVGARRCAGEYAAEHGITVAVTSTLRAQSTLLRTRPIRIDLIEPNGTPVEVIAERDDSLFALDNR